MKEASHSKELAQALVYQRREQAALMAFLHGKAEKEAEARARLHQMSRTAPWTKEHSVEDIEESWNQWAKDKQVGTVGGEEGTQLLATVLTCDSCRRAKSWEQLTSPRSMFGTPNSWPPECSIAG